MTKVGVVIIGRNEGERLATCLTSVRIAAESGAALFQVPQIVYVDSNSTDNSVEIARSYGAQIIQLDPDIAFTAARARNAGAEALLRRHPQIDLLQFLDGDTEMHPRWLAHAVDYLAHHEKVAVACGRRRERFPEASVYNLLADMEWDTPIGSAGEFGGDALIRATVFLHFAGYTAGFIAGEEPDFAARMRKEGHQIVRLNHEMTLHDVAMTRFTQWWRRAMRSGHALAQLAHTHGKAPLYFYRHAWKSTLLWGLCVPLFILTLTLVLSPWCLGLLPVAYTYLFRRITRYRLGRGDDRKSALTYALFVTMGKFPEMAGLLTFYKNLWLRRQTRLIEYKSAPPASHAPHLAPNRIPANPPAVVVGNT